MDNTIGTLTEAKVWIAVSDLQKAKELAKSMRGEGCKVRLASDRKILETALECGETVDTVVVEENFGGECGWRGIRSLCSASAQKPWVVVACENESGLAAAFLDGAEDAIVSGQNEIVLRARLRRLLERRRLRNLLDGLELIDSATGLPNAFALSTALEREARRSARTGEPLAYAKVSIDFYDKIKTDEGEEKAREISLIVALSIAKALPRAADFVASLGDGEFVIILPDTAPDGAKVVGERLRSAVEDLDLPTDVSEISTRVTASIGIGVSSEYRDETGESIVIAAEEALAYSKSRGRAMLTVNESREPWEAGDNNS